MRVLKFGGTSVANAERFLRVADILESNARQGQVATVLSAPAKITNHLVAMIEKTIGGQDALPNIADAERIFAELLQGLADAQPAFPLAQLKAFVEQEFAQIKHVLHGISLLGQCPDSVNAALICRGEKLSIAIMAGLLEARGHKVSVINPVEKLLAVGHYLESTVDIAESTRRIAASQIPADHMILMAGFTAGNEKGELVVRKGDRVSREQQLKLQTLYKSAADPVRWGVVLGAFLFSLILSIGFFVAPSGKPGTPLRCKDMLLISLVLFLFSVGAKGAFCLATRFDSLTLMANYAVAFPIAGGVGLVAMVFAARRYCTMSLLLCFFAMLMFQADYTFFLYHFLGGMLATWLVTNAQTRQDVVWSIIPLTVGQALIWLGMALLAQISPNEFPMQLGAVAINSLLSLILLFAVSPVLELAFGYSTRFRLMELMSLEHPLMQELMVTIPGTYHHSLVVANMVEAGAKAIGANSLLCKVAALYHDAGKLTYPEYFIENQFGGPNKHDKLAPSMSALIITSHVKKGTELAERYKLGQEIIDIIRQHHGTRVIRYFYQKAINLGERPRESDFSYPGPRPQTKEAAILMLADSVEASSRTLTDPTPARIRTHIDTIIKGIFSEGQLDESELTFKDLHYLSENFQRILTGIFHQRIAYPPAKSEGKQEGKAPEAKNGDVRPAENKAEAKGHENAPAAKEAEEKSETSHSGHHHGRVHDAAAIEAAEKLEAEQLARIEQAGRE